MSHGVTDIDRIVVREGKRTWHGKRTFHLPADAPIEKWAEMAGLTGPDGFSIELDPVPDMRQVMTFPNKNGDPDYWVKTDDIADAATKYRLIRRVGPGSHTEIFGQCTSDYHPVQPADQVEMLRFIAEQGDVSLETMGTVLGGRKVWGLLSLGESWSVNGGKVEGYLAVMNTNDGSGSLLIRNTMVWVECYNTFTMAANRAGGAIDLKMTHRTKLSDGFAKTIAESVGLMRQDFKAFKATAEQLEATPLSKEQALVYVAELSKSGDAMPKLKQRTAGSTEPDGASVLNQILDSHAMTQSLVDADKLNRTGSRILAVMLSGTPGARKLGDPGFSALDAFHATTYYATNDERIARSEGARFDSALGGNANRLKQRGLELLAAGAGAGAVARVN